MTVNRWVDGGDVGKRSPIGALDVRGDGGGARGRPAATSERRWRRAAERHVQRVGLGACRGRLGLGVQDLVTRALELGAQIGDAMGGNGELLLELNGTAGATALRLVRLGSGTGEGGVGGTERQLHLLRLLLRLGLCLDPQRLFGFERLARAPEGHLCLVELLVVLGVRGVCVVLVPRHLHPRLGQRLLEGRRLARVLLGGVPRRLGVRSRKLECGFYSPLSVSRCLHARVQLRVGGLQLGLRQLEGRLLLGTSRVRRLDVRTVFGLAL